MCEGRKNWADGGTGTVGNTPYGGTGNSRDGNKMPNVGTVDGGNRDRDREGVGKSRYGTKYTREDSRPDPFPTRPHFPDPTITAHALAKYYMQFSVGK